MDGLTRQLGAWEVSHVPGGHNAYDRVLGRMTPWALMVEHVTGWRIIQYERSAEAEIVTPGGVLVQVITVSAFALPTAITSPRHEVLIEALRAWVNAHAEEYEEVAIGD